MKDITKIVVASDSFKGSLSSLEVAQAVAEGGFRVFPKAEVIRVNVADGGEGTIDAIIYGLGGKRVQAEVSNPLLRPRSAHYGIVPSQGIAVIEMAEAAGLVLLEPNERNPMKTSTFGVGELIADSRRRGCRRFLVGIGGSATNDAGMGMLEALGTRFYDTEGQLLRGCGENLGKVETIDLSDFDNRGEFTIACDVDTPFCGPDGAAFVFSPQKGAPPQMAEELDKGMWHFVRKIAEATGCNLMETGNPTAGAGAAGGLGGAFKAFFNARLERGIDMVLDAIGFDKLITGADLVITGEGKMDCQTSHGKTPFGILKRARLQGIPCIAVCGKVENMVDGYLDIIQATPDGMPLSQAMRRDTAMTNVSNAVEVVLKRNFDRYVRDFRENNRMKSGKIHFYFMNLQKNQTQ